MKRFTMLVALAIVACGRPATEEECEKILERVAKLELEDKPGVRAEEIESHVAATKEAMKKRAMDQCVGNRITDEALRCVERATSAEQIVEECFD